MKRAIIPYVIDRRTFFRPWRISYHERHEFLHAPLTATRLGEIRDYIARKHGVDTSCVRFTTSFFLDA